MLEMRSSFPRFIVNVFIVTGICAGSSLGDGMKEAVESSMGDRHTFKLFGDGVRVVKAMRQDTLGKLMQLLDGNRRLVGLKPAFQEFTKQITSLLKEYIFSARQGHQSKVMALKAGLIEHLDEHRVPAVKLLRRILELFLMTLDESEAKLIGDAIEGKVDQHPNSPSYQKQHNRMFLRKLQSWDDSDDGQLGRETMETEDLFIDNSQKSTRHFFRGPNMIRNIMTKLTENDALLKKLAPTINKFLNMFGTQFYTELIEKTYRSSHVRLASKRDVERFARKWMPIVTKILSHLDTTSMNKVGKIKRKLLNGGASTDLKKIVRRLSLYFPRDEELEPKVSVKVMTKPEDVNDNKSMKLETIIGKKVMDERLGHIK